MTLWCFHVISRLLNRIKVQKEVKTESKAVGFIQSSRGMRTFGYPASNDGASDYKYDFNCLLEESTET